MRRTCKQCGREFELEDSEIEWYQSKGMQLPKRCEDCRAANRKKRDDGRTGSDNAKRGEGNAAAGAAGNVASGAAGNVASSIAHGAGAAAGNHGGSSGNGRPSASRQGGKGVPSRIIGAVAAVVIAAAVGSGVIAPDAGTGQPSNAPSSVASTPAAAQSGQQVSANAYEFRSNSLMNSHYDKHGKEMGYASAQEYVAGANAVVVNPAALHKKQAEDGDDVYYLQATDELVIVSTDGYLRTYFNPGGVDYFNRQ